MPSSASEESVAAKKTPAEDIQKAYLFTTKTCPNCRVADAMLTKAAISYSKIDAEENQELTAAYDVTSSPDSGDRTWGYGGKNSAMRLI